MQRIVLASLALCLLPLASNLNADEIGFIEKYALSADRESALKELVPGTEDYYYFHCLHFQNTEQYDKVDQLLNRWIKSHDYKYRATQNISRRAREIVNRQMLLTYAATPQRTLTYLENHLRLKFNHQRESFSGPTLGSVLDASLISRKTLTANALASNSALQGFEQSATRWLLDTQLGRNDLYYAMKRVQVPNHPKLVQVINQFLSEDVHEFGREGIHLQLTKPQLMELAKLRPRLLNNHNFVNVFLTKIRPNPDIHFDSNKNEQKAHLNELWDFVKQLSPSFNTLKAHVLYRRLLLDRSEGIYDRERFMDYIKLPREASYIRTEYHRRKEFNNYKINFNHNYKSQTTYGSIGNDEPLIRSYLQHFFVNDQDYKAFEDYIHDDYLRRNFAETKIVNGLGDPEKWATYISATDYKNLRNRVDLDFAFTSKQKYEADENVSIEVNVKNVEKLIVKVFEINTANYYRDQQKPIDTNIELDGLLANKEYTFEYDSSPFHRVKRKFEFPELNKKGVFVVDFIGNRKSSRALIRKGQLRYVENQTSAGHEFTIVDEKNNQVDGASIWMGGSKFDAGEDGKIVIPYSTREERVPIVISKGDFCSLDYFFHSYERYKMEAAFHVDREALLNGENAQVIIRSQLKANGIPVSVKLLKNVQLKITSSDLDRSVSTKIVKDFKLFEDRESEFEFRVPRRLQFISFALSGTVENLSQAKPVSLSFSQSFDVNQIDTGIHVEDLHLSKINGEYFVDLLGKNGELRVGRSIQVMLKHRDFKSSVKVALQTNMKGRIKLGKLTDISKLTVSSPEGIKRSWELIGQQNSYTNTIHAAEGKSIQVPMAKFDSKLTHQDVSLFEMRGGTHYRNAFSHLKLKDGILSIAGLTRGDYRLIINNIKMVHIKVAKGKLYENFVFNKNRQLELKRQKPIQVSAIDRNEDKTIIRVANADKFSRVHVVATRYLPRFDIFKQLNLIDSEPSLTTLPQSQSLYVAGRKIGDEYQYILDRKYAEKYPGVMLKRPGLLLQPWAVRSTQTSRQAPRSGTEFDASDDSMGTGRGMAGGVRGNRRPTVIDASNLDFLPTSSKLFLNLEPNEKGVVEIDNKLFGDRQHIHVCAVTTTNAAARDASYAEKELEPIDRRFVFGLDPAKRFARKKQISFVDKDKSFDITDVATGEFELYDNLPNVYRLFISLTNNPQLAEFGFILEWNDKMLEEKMELYSKYACHELNFFLYKKDPAFFANVVRPYISNKKDKTFLDKWLLESELDNFVLPWEYSQLNSVERILLSQVLDGESENTGRHIRESYFLNPTSQARFDALFGYAVQGNALETGGSVIGKELDELQDLIKFQSSNVKSVERDKAVRLSKSPVRGKTNSADAGGAVRYAQPGAPAQAAGDPGAFGGIAGGRNALRMTEKSEVTKELRQQMEKKRKGVDFRRNADFYENGSVKRGTVAQLFRQIDKTQEWAENNYYKLTIDKQNSSLVKVNQFWRDYAAHKSDRPFYSINVAEASSNFTEMMFALSVLDLAWKPGKHDSSSKDNKLTIKAKTPLLIFHDQIRPAADGRKETSVLVSQNFFKVSDRYRYEGPDRLDKFVTDEFIKRTAYGCQVVVTNPTSAKQKIDLLLQIPKGAMPLKATRETKSAHLELEPYRTSSIEYFFYFPEPGKFSHYPVNVSRKEEVVAFAEPITFNVVDQPSKVDKSSWDYVSQNGSEEDVFNYLNTNNLQRTDLNKIAWRMADKPFFEKAISLLGKNHIFQSVLWSYAVKHDQTQVIKQFLTFNSGFVSATGPYIDAELLTNDRVARKTYEHLEYSPLVNARAHQLGKNRRILNDRFHAQYHRLLWILGCKTSLTDRDRMALTYYLILQDRITEAKSFFEQVSSNNIKTKIQYDYMAAYLDMFNSDPVVARRIAAKYTKFPVERWRNAFGEIANQLNEIDGKATQIVDNNSRENVQDKVAAQSAAFDFKVDDKKIDLNFQNLKEVQVNYYIMDVELLFSRNPFVRQFAGEMTYIRPRKSQTIKLPGKSDSHQWKLPKEFDRQNILIEISNGQQVKTQAYYAHAMNVQMVESYGQLKVVNAQTGRQVPKTYCKVYAQMKDGSTRFYKDGYTDLRGRFDYTSLSTNDLDNVNKFSVLIMNDELGATVREAIPPKR